MQKNFFSPRYLLIIFFAVITLVAVLLYEQKSQHEQHEQDAVQETVVNQEIISAIPATQPAQLPTQEPITKETVEPAPIEKKEPAAQPSFFAAPTSDKPEHLSCDDYCKGFTSLSAEFKLKKLNIEGVIPSWLYGSFITVGPAKFEVGEHKAHHWLEGFAMIHRFSFKNGHVSYLNRFLNTTFAADSMKQGKFRSNSISDPNSSYFTRLAQAMSKKERPPYDNTNVNIIQHGNYCMALTETPHAIVYDTRTLQTKGLCVYKDDLEPHVSTAHPLIDKETGDLYNIATTFAKKSSYTVYKMSPNSMNRVPLITIPASYPSYMHSFAMSKRYLIITEIPYVVSPYDLALSGKPYIENFKWKPRQKTKITIINKSNGTILRTYELPPFFTFHHINAYDTGAQVVLDLITLPDGSHMQSFFLGQQKNINFPQGTVSRILLDLNSSNAQMSALSSLPLEMPRISPHMIGKQYRYLYALNSSHNTGCYDRIIKLDVTTGKYIGWHQDYCYVNEAVFVPKPDNVAEDDGVVLSVVLNTKTGNSSLIILDGITLKMIAQVQLPHHIPFTAHSAYFSKDKK